MDHLNEIEWSLLALGALVVIGSAIALRRAWALPRVDTARELAVVVAAGLLVAGIGTVIASWADGVWLELRDQAAAVIRGSLLVLCAYVAVWGIRGTLRRRP